jgi:hypothetical protein
VKYFIFPSLPLKRLLFRAGAFFVQSTPKVIKYFSQNCFKKFPSLCVSGLARVLIAVLPDVEVKI